MLQLAWQAFLSIFIDLFQFIVWHVHTYTYTQSHSLHTVFSLKQFYVDFLRISYRFLECLNDLKRFIWCIVKWAETVSPQAFWRKNLKFRWNAKKTFFLVNFFTLIHAAYLCPKKAWLSSCGVARGLTSSSSLEPGLRIPKSLVKNCKGTSC